MTPADLTAAGRALYGEFWQTALSRNLGVSKMSMRRWHGGYREIPDSVAANIIELLAARQVERIRDVNASNGSAANGNVLVVYNTDDDLREISGDEWSAQFHGRMAERIIATVLHGSAGGYSPAISSCRYGRRTYSGRPSSSIRFSAPAAIATSVARRRSVRNRRPSPMTRLKRLMSASTRARQ